jgi:hypothetical protein
MTLSEPLTDEELAAIEELAEAATLDPGLCGTSTTTTP